MAKSSEIRCFEERLKWWEVLGNMCSVTSIHSFAELQCI